MSKFSTVPFITTPIHLLTKYSSNKKEEIFYLFLSDNGFHLVKCYLDVINYQNVLSKEKANKKHTNARNDKDNNNVRSTI